MNNTNFTPTVIELFAGCGGMALGFEQAGFEHALLNDNDKHACETLLLNRPDWPVLQHDIRTVDFTPFHNKVDVVAGGFPCQAFSSIGKKGGFDDERGALFFEYARAIRESKPKFFIAENVKGLLYHNNGQTLKTILETLNEAGYRVLEPQLLNAAHYRVPQLRERVFIVGVKHDVDAAFEFPLPDNKMYTLRDTLKAGDLYPVDVPHSSSAVYNAKKRVVLSQVPPGENWKSLSEATLKDYLGDWYPHVHGSQIARRLSWDKPSYTLVTTPQSRLIDRCHPDETRPLTIREYARIQTFPDDWSFAGGITAQYRQIANAVPVNLATSLAQALRHTLTPLFI